jgi:hypothetical protein
VARARRHWMREQGMFDPARLVFIDETCTHTKMVRLCGRSPRGERLIGYAPHGHRKTITFVAGLRQDFESEICLEAVALWLPTIVADSEVKLDPSGCNLGPREFPITGQ